MLNVLNTTWALMLGIFLLQLGNGLQGTLLGVRGSLEGIDPSVMGYVMSGYFVGFLGGSKLTPILLGQVGYIRVFAALGSIVSAAFILYASIVSPMAWFFFRVVVGFSICGIYVVAESWLNHSADNATRGQALSLYLIVQMTGIVLGQLLLNTADPSGYDLFVLISVLVSLSITPMLLSSTAAPLHQSSQSMSLRELMDTSPLGTVGMFLMGGVFACLFAMSPIYATERGLSLSQTSTFIMMIFIGGMVFQYPIGWLSDRMDRRRLIVVLAIIGAFMAWIGIMFDSFGAVVIAGLVIGGTSNPLYSLLVAYTNDYLEHDQMSAAAGGLLFVNGLGAMFGPILIGYAMSSFGAEWFFITLLLLMSAIALYGIYRMTRRSTVDIEYHVPYVPMGTRSTPITAEMAMDIVEEEVLEAAEEAEEADSAGDVGDSEDERN
ncbi:MAG: MFS transporter [Gammaproteobacteria bacterium]|nr:MAG: MFS transporter [Gammaproteobacteria bacterium]